VHGIGARLLGDGDQARLVEIGLGQRRAGSGTTSSARITCRVAVGIE
jgi:hypothetical protein